MYNLSGKTNVEYISKIEPLIWWLIKRGKLKSGNIVTSDKEITVNLQWKKKTRSFSSDDGKRLYYKINNIARCF
jgi:hypothetical protein